MADRVLPGPVSDADSVREAVCVHTRKIYSNCRDKDCVEDLRFYPTVSSQTYIDAAASIRPRSAELLFAEVDVEEIPFNRGYYTVDVRYFYRVLGEAYSLSSGRSEIRGLCIFDKRAIMFGSEGSAKVFTSETPSGTVTPQFGSKLPVAVVSAVDPIVLGMTLSDPGSAQPSDPPVSEVPQFITESFGEELVLDDDNRRVYATLGQFSIIRLERDSQLLMPAYDYCMPDSDCADPDDDTPCTLFSRITFPVDEFFPPDSLDAPEGYREVQSTIAR